MTALPILSFDRGTLILQSWESPPPPFFVWDSRSLVWRAPAFRYRELVEGFLRPGKEIQDAVQAFSSVGF